MRILNRGSVASCILHLAAVSPLLAQPVVTGEVFSSPNEPLAGARVELAPILSNYELGRLRLEGRDLPSPSAIAKSDGQGRFTIQAPHPGVWRVVVRAPGWVPMQLGPLLLLEPEELPRAHLGTDAGSRIEVVGGDGRPLQGAWIVATVDSAASSGGQSASGWQPEFRLGTTAADGSLTLPRFPTERLSVSVFAPGRAEERRRSFEQGTIRLETKPAHSTLLLHVVAPTGEPVPGILVRSGSHSWPVGLSGPDGSVLLRIGTREESRLFLVAPDGRHHVFRLRVRSKGARETVVLPPPLRITGRVIESGSDKGIPGATLWLANDPAIVFRTDGRGSYILAAPERRTLALVARAVGFLPKRLTISPSELASGRAPTLALERAGIVTASIVDPEGRPLGGATVEAVHSPNLGARGFSPRDPVTDRAASDLEGRLELRRLRTGERYELRVRKPGYFPAALEAVARRRDRSAAALKIKLLASCGIHGVLQDPQGRPLTGASVFVQPALRPERKSRSADETRLDLQGSVSVETGPAGRFAMLESPSAEVDLEARMRGFAPALRRSIHFGPNCRSSFDLGTIVLHTGVRLEGRVVDRGGQSLGGAEIFRVERVPPRTAWAETVLGRKADASSNADGRFILEDLASGVPQHLLVRAEGFLVAVVRGVRPPGRGPLLVRMDQAVSLRGKIVDEASEGVSGARIELEWQAVLPNDPKRRPVGEPILRLAISDAEGRFEIEDVPEGEVSIHVTAHGYAPIANSAVRLPLAPEQELSFTLRRGATLSGRVTSGGDPVSAARISVGEHAAFSDAEGAYVLDGVLPGDYEIEVFHPQYPREVQPVLIEEGSNRLDVEFALGFEVTGRVLNRDAQPVAGAEVELTTWHRSERRSLEARTDEDGAFLLRPVVPDRYRLQARAEGLAPGEVPGGLSVEDQPVNGVEVVLGPGATITGWVLGLSEQELTAVVVTAHGRSGESRAANLDFEGRFEVRDLPQGDWLLRASLWNGSRQAEAWVPIGPDDRWLQQELEFGQGLTLSGRVLLAEEPLDSSVVSLRGERFSTERSVVSGFDGSFLFQDLEADRYWLGVKNAARLLVHNETLELTEDLDVTIRFETASLAGRVSEAGGGTPIPGALLSLRPLEGTDFLITDSSKVDGTFQVIHVPPGLYRLTATARGHAPAEQEVLLAPGAEVLGLELELLPTEGLEIQVHLASGQPPGMVHVLARDGAGAPILTGSFMPAPSGSTELSSLPSGDWQLTVSAPGGGTVTRWVTVPAEPMTIVLPSAGNLHVLVPELARENVLATVRLVRPDQKPFWKLGFGGGVEQAWTLRGGRGTVEAVPAGMWWVIAEASDGRLWAGSVATSGSGEALISLE